MELRKTRREDLTAVMEILRQAQEFLKIQGVNQWQNGYPNEEVVQKDWERDESYVLVEAGRVIATAVLSFRPEPTYEKIYEGQWLYDGKSAVIHRVATDESLRGQGIAAKLLGQLAELCEENGMDSVRIDTHEENLPMQALVKKLGYEPCGVIYMPDGVGRRVAFERAAARGRVAENMAAGGSAQSREA